MKTYLTNHDHFGKCLFIENGDIKIGVPTEFGIRISFLSYKGSENLFYEQPKNVDYLCSDEGWRVQGGHRLWLAPESKLSAYPDNDPISYQVLDDKVILFQDEDPWLKVRKTMEISFEGENQVKVVHKLENTDSQTRRFSSWGITSMAPYGVQYIPMQIRKCGDEPLSKITLWDYTNLGDERAEYSRELIKITHRPNNDSLYKIGVAHPDGHVKYNNRGVVFEKIYDVFRNEEYPDGNVSYETYLCDQMVEIESLSPLYDVQPGQTIGHTEVWKLTNEK